MESESNKRQRESKNYYNIKCKCYSNRGAYMHGYCSNRGAYMHGYCSNCVFMHNFIPIDLGVFFLKCVKSISFFILHNFA